MGAGEVAGAAGLAAGAVDVGAAPPEPAASSFLASCFGIGDDVGAGAAGFSAVTEGEGEGAELEGEASCGAGGLAAGGWVAG